MESGDYMNTRFYNAKILTMNSASSEIIEGELWVSDGKIVRVGDEYEPDYMYMWDQEIDCEGDVLMPGFKNAHAHAPMTFLRSLADDMPLDRWLNELVFPAEAKLSAEDIYELTKLAICEYLTSGITSSFEMYYHPESIARAATEMGYRVVLCSSTIGQDIKSIDVLDEEYNTYNNYNDLISYKLGFHAEYTTSREVMEGVARLANNYKAPVYMHSQETKKEVADCIGRYGMSPTKIFDKLGIFNYGGGCYHMVYSDDEDIAILKKRGVSIISNPGSNSKLASGIAPITTYINKGLNVALGTDGPASNNALDMYREMYLATILQKLSLEDASALSGSTVLRMATVNGAYAMGLENGDTLAVGKLADIIRIDMKRPNMQPAFHIVDNLVYSGSKENVKMTMVQGNILYENGRFTNVDIDDIIKKSQDIRSRIC